MPRSLRNSRLIHDQFGQGLIHRHGGSRNTGAHIRDPRQLQQTLHSTILAILAMQYREHHINALTHNTVALKTQQTLTPNGRDGRPAIVGASFPGPVGQHRIVVAAKQDPVPLLGNPNGEYIIFFLIDVIEYRLGRAQGDLMLRAYAAKQDANT